MPGAIDVHTHHYPPEVARDPKGWAARQGEPYWARLVTEGPQGWATDAQFIAAMDTAGIARAVLQGWYWERLETCRWHNRFLGACRQVWPDRWSAFAALQPAAGVSANLELLEEAREAGFCGIGEIHPTAQGFSLRDEAWLALCDWAGRHRWPITLHVTEPVGHEYPGRLESPLMDLVWLAEQFPAQPFILAHWGGGLPFFVLNRRVGRALRQCYVDTAASPLLYRPEIWKAVTEIFGAERILFGSDFPLRLWPRQELEPSILALRRELESAGLPAAAVTDILGGNAARLLPEA
jgi:uncharacterized protein